MPKRACQVPDSFDERLHKARIDQPDLIARGKDRRPH